MPAQEVVGILARPTAGVPAFGRLREQHGLAGDQQQVDRPLQVPVVVKRVGRGVRRPPVRHDHHGRLGRHRAAEHRTRA